MNLLNRLSKAALVIFCFLSVNTFAERYELKSPSSKLVIKVVVEGAVQWSASLNGTAVIEPSTIDLILDDGSALATAPKVLSAKTENVSQIVSPVVRYKSEKILDEYRGLTVTLKSGLSIEFRAYDDGAVYRLITDLDDDITIQNEVMNLRFAKDSTSLFPEEETLISHYERLYLKETVSKIASDRFASLPAYVETPAKIHVVFTEADLFDYPGLFLQGTSGHGFDSKFMPYVKKAWPKQGSEDRNQDFEFADFIAKTNGKRSYPWRVAVIGDEAADLINSQLVFLLSRENLIDDPKWIKPGRVAWDWYNANNLYNVDFKSGIDNQTYKYYIDFASKYGIEYVILDEGWSKTTTNVHEPNPNIDVPELVQYGKKRDVKIILWSLWGPMDEHHKTLLPLYEKWGVAGIKIDFVQRADQYMVNYYERIAREAAKHKLLVDYHGGFKPAGLRRAYPNVISYEGVKGSENNKWSADITPEHNVTLPFIRMVAGPMDYTPGAMRNMQLANHQINHFRPASIGTRAHQVAMYAVYESALQMYCDSPSAYLSEPATIEFISQFPSVWDETRVLHAAVGDYIVVARRSGEDWFIGAMTDDTEREFDIDFSFLAKGKYMIDYYADGLNTENYAQDYKRASGKVSAKDSMKIRLASGGGWAAIVRK